MLKIYLARHGQDKDNANGILNGQRNEPLTEKGVEQANEVAQKILGTGITFDKIYASPLQRAYKTAEIISQTLGMQIPEKLDDLIERNFGVMTGVSQTKIVEICEPDILKTDTVTYFLSPPESESFPDLINRANRLLNYLNDHHKNGNILLVSHGDFGKMLYCAYYKLDWKEVLRMFHFGNSELILLSEDSPADEVHVFKINQHNL